MNDYIHINEAVKKYAKTRQTFYNYIHKGLVETKKVNNKVYLNINDIEKIISDYLVIDESDTTQQQLTSKQEIISPSTGEKTYADIALEEDLANLQKQYHTLENTLVSKLQHNKEDILFDTKALHYNQEQRMMTTINQQHKELQHYKKRLEKGLKKLSLKNKKMNFRIGYCVIILIQSVIAGYVL